MEGTIRSYDNKVYSIIKENIVKLLQGLEHSHGIKAGIAIGLLSRC